MGTSDVFSFILTVREMVSRQGEESPFSAPKG